MSFFFFKSFTQGPEWPKKKNEDEANQNRMLKKKEDYGL